MKKIVISFLLVFTVISYAQASDDNILAKIIAVKDSGVVLEVAKNNFKENDKIYILPAGETIGIVTNVKNNTISITLKNNGFAVGSKVIVNYSSKRGKLGSKKAEVKENKSDKLVLFVKDNNFKIDDEIKIEPDGDKKTIIKSLDKNIITIKTNSIGYAKGSNIIITKKYEGFREKFKEKAKTNK